jgi:hypothetical protein
MINSIISDEIKQSIENLVEEVLLISLSAPHEIVEYSLMNIEDHIQQMCNCIQCNDICGFYRHYEISFNLVENLNYRLKL